MKSLLLSLSILVFFLGASIGIEGKVITLFEDDDSFISQLSRQDTATNIENEEEDVFYGEIAIKVSAPQGSAANNVQRYNPNIPDWNYKIVEDPSKEDEARWIMFAWKKIGGEGIMIQFPDNGSWGAVTQPCVKPPAPGTRRYIDGQNMTGWSGICLSDEIPEDWEVVIRDLFADFGSFTMTGIALTPFDNVGLYDSIYLAWSEAELEKLLTSMTPVQLRDKLTTVWGYIKGKMSR